MAKRMWTTENGSNNMQVYKQEKNSFLLIKKKKKVTKPYKKMPTTAWTYTSKTLSQCFSKNILRTVMILGKMTGQQSWKTEILQYIGIADISYKTPPLTITNLQNSASLLELDCVVTRTSAFLVALSTDVCKRLFPV